MRKKRMTLKLTGMPKAGLQRDAVEPATAEYEDHFAGLEQTGQDQRRSDYNRFVTLYYDLVTDFYEYGWGRSFHFAPRAPRESFRASLARHEHYLALRLGLRPGMRVADLGCGVGGPLREIVRFSGANVVGVNNSAYQLQRARKQTDDAGLNGSAEYLECDFMHVDARDSSFDAVYAIEATCHAPRRVGVFREAFRLLKPGGAFASYEYCLTDRFDEGNPRDLRLKRDIETGGGMQSIVYRHEVDSALREAGFEVLETRDLAEQTGPGIPWYQPLVGSGLSFAGFRSSKAGRILTHGTLRVLETLRIVPKGTVRVSILLNLCAAAMAESGRLRIFTPMYFVLGRRPE